MSELDKQDINNEQTETGVPQENTPEQIAANEADTDADLKKRGYNYYMKFKHFDLASSAVKLDQMNARYSKAIAKLIVLKYDDDRNDSITKIVNELKEQLSPMRDSIDKRKKDESEDTIEDSITIESLKVQVKELKKQVNTSDARVDAQRNLTNEAEEDLNNLRFEMECVLTDTST